MVLLCLVSETPFVRGDASKSCCVINPDPDQSFAGRSINKYKVSVRQKAKVSHLFPYVYVYTTTAIGRLLIVPTGSLNDDGSLNIVVRDI